MRKWLMILVAFLITVWLLMWVGATTMNRLYRSDSDRAWPLGLGPLSEVEKRYPPAPTTASASMLIDRAGKLGIDIAPRGGPRTPARPLLDPNVQLREKVTTYLASQIQKTTPEIDPPPAELTDYLAAHAGDLAGIRDLLLGDEEVAWAVEFPSRRAPIPNLLGHMVLHRFLLMNALDRARRGDSGAWEDARAVVAMSRGLSKRPEIISGLIALAMDKSVNAVARKLPLPAPPWFAEFQKFDYTRALLAARQAEMSAISDAVYAEVSIDDHGDQGVRRIVYTMVAPYLRLATNDALEADRRTAVEVAARTACDVDAREMTRRRRESLAWWNYPARRMSQANLDAIWQRVLRFRVELEATDRALRLRAGEPPVPKSGCSDGAWVYSENGFRFSKTLTRSQVPASAIPVEFSLDARH